MCLKCGYMFVAVYPIDNKGAQMKFYIGYVTDDDDDTATDEKKNDENDKKDEDNANTNDEYDIKMEDEDK